MNTANDNVDISRRRLLGGALAATALLTSLPWARNAFAASPASVAIVVFDENGQRVGKRTLEKVVKTDAEWRAQLSPAAYHITREAGTESPYSGDYEKPDVAGIYRCVCCDTALYDAAAQFHSGTGWPSFWEPIAADNVAEHVDNTFGMRRTEIVCSRCDAHQGHVFEDGPKPTGLRYCMNAVGLRFVATEKA